MSEEKDIGNELRQLPSFQADQIKTLYRKITELEKKLNEMKSWEDYLAHGGLLEQIMEKVEKLEKWKVFHIGYIEQELSELKVRSAAHTESEDGIRRHTTKNEKEIKELKEQLESLRDNDQAIINTNVLREFIDYFMKYEGMDLRQLLDKLGGDTASSTSHTVKKWKELKKREKEGYPELNRVFLDKDGKPSQPPRRCPLPKDSECTMKHLRTCNGCPLKENPSEQDYSEYEKKLHGKYADKKMMKYPPPKEVAEPSECLRTCAYCEMKFRTIDDRKQHEITHQDHIVVEKADLESSVEGLKEWLNKNRIAWSLRSISIYRIYEKLKKYLKEEKKDV